MITIRMVTGSTVSGSTSIWKESARRLVSITTFKIFSLPVCTCSANRSWSRQAGACLVWGCTGFFFKRQMTVFSLSRRRVHRNRSYRSNWRATPVCPYPRLENPEKHPVFLSNSRLCGAWRIGPELGSWVIPIPIASSRFLRIIYRTRMHSPALSMMTLPVNSHIAAFMFSLLTGTICC